MDPSPFQVQYVDDRRGRDAPKVLPKEKWEDANITQFEIMLREMKKSLEDFPRDIAMNTWNDMSAWLKDYLRTTDKSKEESIPFAEAHFGALKVTAYHLAEVRQQVLEVSGDAHKLSVMLASKLKELDALQRKKEEAQPGEDTSQLDNKIEAVKSGARALDAAVAAKEKEAQAADGADEIADNTEFVPIDDTEPAPTTDPWPEDNYEDFATKRSALLARQKPTGKVKFSNLIVRQKAPADSKTLMPRAIEFFTVKEIDAVTPKSLKSRWNNYYEDPVEPAKCWSEEEFEKYHERPGFHFMIACVAQAGAQFTDNKLSLLRAKLSERWKISVTFQCMRPRMDWMLATVPELTELSSEILDTDLIHLNEGNASYVVRHFGEPNLVRDLEITIANTITEPGSLFAKLKKRCQEFEKSGTFVGWRVAGVRSANAAAKYRATFYLKNIDAYWPWFYDWSHPHGSIPQTIPLLNFDPIWKARKPYACQLCYSSDHSLLECPLPHIKIGGVPLVSAVSRGLCMNRSAAERRGWTDDPLKPVGGGSARPRDTADEKVEIPTLEARVDTKDAVEEPTNEDDGDAIMADDTLQDSITAGLERAKTQFNDPFAQLQSMLPYLHNDTIREALDGRSVEEALVYLKVVSPTRTSHPAEASGSGRNFAQHIDSAAHFIAAKLRRVFQKTEVVEIGELSDLLQACNGDIALVVATLQKTGTKFSWSETDMDNEWRDWCDSKVTPQAATPMSTSMSRMGLLEDPHAYDYNQEASFMSAMVDQASIILHPGINMAELAKTYRGQFPAMIRKMTISYNTSFPSSWTEKWLMDAYSLWLMRPLRLEHLVTSPTAAAAEHNTPHNAATRQATAPVIDLSTADSQRMYP